jgi:hypothetical protein
MKNNLLFMSFLLLIFFACQKDVVKSEFDEAMAKVKFQCTGNKDSIFFQGKMGGQDFCMSSDVIGASAKSGTGGNSFSIYFYPTRGDVSYTPLIIIESPVIDSLDAFGALVFVAQPPVRIYDKLLVKGESFPIQAIGDNKSKFKIRMEVSSERVKVDGGFAGTSYRSESASGIQTKDSFIIFDEVAKKDNGSTVTYDVKGRFSCKLYFGSNLFYKDLSDVKFKFSTVANK